MRPPISFFIAFGLIYQRELGRRPEAEAGVLGMRTTLEVQVPCGAAEGYHELKATA